MSTPDSIEALANQEAGEGWQARLELRFQLRDGCTRLTRNVHRGPLLVQRAFYPEGPTCHLYVIHPPGGVVSGDHLALEVEVEPRAHTVLTTPAAGKFYRRHGPRVATLQQTLRVDAGTLEWLPQENIYYPDASVNLATLVHLRNEARFIGWEISCFGLPANQQDLNEGSIAARFELWHDDAPMLLERVRIDRRALHARWGLAGHVAYGTMLAFPANARHLECVRRVSAGLQASDSSRLLVCTLVGNTLCCRGYAARADYLKQGFIELWRALRPEFMGCPAVAPRIWNT